MIRQFFFILSAILFFGNSSSLLAFNKERIEILNKSKNMEETVEVVPRSLLKKRTLELMYLLEKAGSDGLEKVNSSKKVQWNLQSVEIGPGVSGEVGLGFWTVGGTAGFRILFERNKLDEK